MASSNLPPPGVCTDTIIEKLGRVREYLLAQLQAAGGAVGPDAGAIGTVVRDDLRRLHEAWAHRLVAGFRHMSLEAMDVSGEGDRWTLTMLLFDTLSLVRSAARLEPPTAGGALHPDRCTPILDRMMCVAEGPVHGYTQATLLRALRVARTQARACACAGRDAQELRAYVAALGARAEVLTSTAAGASVYDAGDKWRTRLENADHDGTGSGGEGEVSTVPPPPPPRDEEYTASRDFIGHVSGVVPALYEWAGLFTRHGSEVEWREWLADEDVRHVQGGARPGDVQRAAAMFLRRLPTLLGGLALNSKQLEAFCTPGLVLPGEDAARRHEPVGGPRALEEFLLGQASLQAYHHITVKRYSGSWEVMGSGGAAGRPSLACGGPTLVWLGDALCAEMERGDGEGTNGEGTVAGETEGAASCSRGPDGVSLLLHAWCKLLDVHAGLQNFEDTRWCVRLLPHIHTQEAGKLTAPGPPVLLQGPGTLAFYYRGRRLCHDEPALVLFAWLWTMLTQEQTSYPFEGNLAAVAKCLGVVTEPEEAGREGGVARHTLSSASLYIM